MSGGGALEELFAEGDSEDGVADHWHAPNTYLLESVNKISLAHERGMGDGIYDLREASKEWLGRESQIKEAFDRASLSCESPIELTLLPWLLTRHYRPFQFNPLVLLPGEGNRLEYGQIALVPQMPLGRFRADFVLVGKGRDFFRFFVIECDGADYHNAEKDAERDRIIKNENKRVKYIVRLRGGAIMFNPRKCAEIVQECVRVEYSR